MAQKRTEKDREYNRIYRLNHPGAAAAWKHRTGRARPMSEAKDCTLYLGVCIAETALSKFFDNIVRMPHENPGFDFLCGRGYKIDCKSSCINIRKPPRAPCWQFSIKRNKIADYFLCLALDNRENLIPQHVWLIPGHVVNDHKGLSIVNHPTSLEKWSLYEHPTDRVNVSLP